MLEIKTIDESPTESDYIFIFVKDNAVISLQRPPDQFWLRREVEGAFGDVGVGAPLGYWAGRPSYAIEVDAQCLNVMEHMSGSLYSLFGRVSDVIFAAYGRALQMLAWQRDHQFCGRCGTLTAPTDGGKALACVDCGHSAYPRLNPCVIVAVGRGEQLLLATAAGRATGFHSTLAGFIEPGESAEQAVIREVQEEVGIGVTNVRYFTSQPWPFPSQLMLGFFADHSDGEIIIDPAEIAHADWYGRDDLPTVPPPQSIAGQLIHHFFATR
ncbi:NAD(+) diphosphatase [Luminiphilus sp.]|nr:NAD(+) diphosphatase [Luminiphilus sp.]MDA9580013.1 NAD(+) diphosphatase [Luminiphilus sp.]MDB2377131.1 NAD(+) diphosphatase [Luminiphilus sp.]MDB2615711.1 NAD(+) diphosphatase [Luminiphilus sp.]MDB3922629.1 NAD(+) diphosphatase [Luminiphilus sp.]